MQQKAIVHSEVISRKGEIKYFQIPLQGTPVKIIAVEASAFLFTQVVQPAPPPINLLQHDPLFTIMQNEKAGLLSIQSPDITDIFFQCEAWRNDKNISYGDFTYANEMQGEWLKGKKRIATDVSLTTGSPILEAYYKDSWGLYYGKDISYGLNIIIWYENLLSHDK